jgi:hypothetical protein
MHKVSKFGTYRAPATGHIESVLKDTLGKKRWVLKFDDSKMLDQIDAVFVTLEPAAGVTSPVATPFYSPL